MKRGKNQRIDEDEKPSREEYAVAKFLRFGLPVKEGKLHGMEVKYFIATEAVDKLLQSKWSISQNKKNPLFTNRASCCVYLNGLLARGLFHRADRDKRKKERDTGKKKKKEKEKEKEESAADEGVKQRKNKKERKSKKEDEGNEETEGKEKTEKKEEKKKKEKRLKLLMSESQWFEDGDEVFVWIYDPVNAKTFIIGLLMVFGAIGLCMFPLWPEEVRIGVYYLSLAAAGFVGFILFLVVVRLVLFCLIWVVTIGRHHFWFLPNLTEDVGFFESFQPLYKHDSFTGKEETDTGKKKKKKKTEEEKESKGSNEKKEKSSDKDDSDEFEVIKKEELDENKSNLEAEVEEGKDEEVEEEDEDDEMADDNNEDIDENDQYGDDDDDEDLNGEESDEKDNNETKKSK